MHSIINRPVIAIAGAIISQFAMAEETKLEGRGEELLSARCARCHAIARTGESPHSAAPPFRTLSRKYPITGLGESLAEGIWVGHPNIPKLFLNPMIPPRSWRTPILSRSDDEAERSEGCRVGKIARAVVNHPLSIRAIPRSAPGDRFCPREGRLPRRPAG